MELRFSKLLSCISSVLACLLMSASAGAAPKDAEAARMDRTAIYEDYLATNFAAAEKKLNAAIDMCKGTACSPRMRAQLHRDLGIVCIVGLKKNEEGQSHFVQALKGDPGMEIPKELSTPEVQTAWSAAKRGGAPAERPAPPKPPAAASGDIVHTAPTEQAVLTPIPLYAEVPGVAGVAKVQARYKAAGAANWKTVELKKYKNGYAGEISCFDVGSETGEMKYFLQAADSSGDVAATNGTRNAPHTVAIVTELSGEPPRLPGKPAPAQCAGAEGKKGKHGTKGYGAACDNSSECGEGLVCKAESGLCEQGAAGEAGIMPVQPGVSKKNWVSLAAQQDVLLYPARMNACSGGNDINCYWGDNSYYNDTPSVIAGNEIKQGFVMATTRFMIGYDRLLGENVTIGMRWGFAIRGSPATPKGKTFQALHVEGRVAYWFGSAPFTRSGLRFYAQLSGGMAEVDAKMIIPVYNAANDYPPGSADPQGNTQYDQDDPDKIQAWKRTGNTFVAIGPGLMYAFGKNTGAFFEPKVMQMFGTPGTAISFQLGLAQGF